MGASSPSLSAASVVRELQIVAKRFGIRVEEFFVDFDKHRARKLSAEHFRMGLRAAFEGRLTLTEGQVQALLSEYAVTGAEAKGALLPINLECRVSDLISGGDGIRVPGVDPLIRVFLNT
ncbi:hypothetical protein T492DRAFT_130020 [Pavlovales sp. CCMP2436]|nr:hypothetical protein T492DRAFT_130020 [Pavlovales sp. CCMP2436]